MKNLVHIFFVISFLTICSCQSVDRAEEPEDLISESKMINVLTDLVKLDAAQSYSTIEFDKREVNTRALIFEKYKIDSLQFVESSTYYAEDFKANRRIYDSVNNRLENEKKLIDSLVVREREQKKLNKKDKEDEENAKPRAKIRVDR